MKKSLNLLGGALCACALLATVGCDTIRDYSVNSYQGILPSGNVTTSQGSVPATRSEVAAVEAANAASTNTVAAPAK